MTKTVVIIKPDGMKKNIVGEIISRFEKEGLRLVGLKMVQLTNEILEVWYAHHKDKPFFPELSGFMRETPVVAMVVAGSEVVSKVRDLCGPTDSKKAGKGTIRGDFGTDIQRNIIHASDSVESADREIEILFEPHEIF